MKKLLNVVLMLSAMAAVVPAQAIQTRRQANLQVAIVPEAQDLDFAIQNEEQEVQNEQQEVQGQASTLNRKAVIAAAVAAGALATAAYMLYPSASAVVLDCNLVAQAYCAGFQVAAASLEACKAQLPRISCYLF